MWACTKCGEENEDTFDLCWKCSTPSGVRRNVTSEYVEESDSYNEVSLDDENLMVSVASSISSRRHPLSECLILVLRGLSGLAVIWGVINTLNAIEIWRRASENASRFGGFPNGSASIERAGAYGVFSAILISATLVTVLLTMGELLKLAIAIESKAGQVSQLDEQSKSQP